MEKKYTSLCNTTMKRPFADYRPIGPFAVKDSPISPSALKREDDDERYLMTLNLQGNVEKYGQEEKSMFANFVKASLREQTIMFSTYKGHKGNTSPYTGDTYKAHAIMGNKNKLNKEELMRSINEDVDRRLQDEFMVESIELEPNPITRD